MKKFRSQLLAFILLGILLSSCQFVTHNSESKPVKEYVVKTSVVHPDWTENAVIYEVNLRQYTSEGTIKAFAEHLPRLQEMGVDILWLMPIHPIGVIHRKGTLGSYYAVKDYYAVNPEFGNLDDLKDLVKEAHALNMFVIIDWVANHTAWDNQLTVDHPDWYDQDSLGKPVSPHDWYDIVQFDFKKSKELWTYMEGAMKYWVTEANIDGFRCDYAGGLPCDFWVQARTSIDSVKPVFMLAENEDNNCLVEKAFDMNYGWEFHHIMNKVAKGDTTVKVLEKYFAKCDSLYDPAIYRMNFITNHDENTWSGTEFERMGNAVEAMAVLSFTVPGMPLIYNGQEVGLDRRLSFFEKDTIGWSAQNKWPEFYKKLIELKKENPCFWNGTAGGSMEILNIKDTKHVFGFVRNSEEGRAIVLFNFGDKKTEFKLKDKKLESNYVNFFTNEDFDFEAQIKLEPNGYLVLLEQL